MHLLFIAKKLRRFGNLFILTLIGLYLVAPPNTVCSRTLCWILITSPLLSSIRLLLFGGWTLSLIRYRRTLLLWQSRLPFWNMKFPSTALGNVPVHHTLLAPPSGTTRPDQIKINVNTAYKNCKADLCVIARNHDGLPLTFRISKANFILSIQCLEA